MKPRALLLPIACTGVMIWMPRTQAATYYWDSNGTTAGFASTSGTWGSSTFWSTSSAGTASTANTTILATDDINFGTAANAYTGTVTLNGGKSAYSMTFGGTGAITFVGDTASRAITLGNGGITMDSGAGAVTLGNGTAINDVTIALAAGAQTWTNNSASNFTISNSAAASISRSTGATLTFNKTSTGDFVMSTTHLPNDATGIIGPWSFFGTGTSQRYAYNNSGTIAAYTGGTAAAGAEDLTSATTNYDFDGSGINTLTASRTANTIRYTGTGTTIDLGASGANTLTANGILAVGTSGTLTIQRTGGTGTLATGSSGELVIAGSQNVSISAPISGTNLTYAGTGILTLSGVNTYTGTTTVGSGTMVIDGASVLPTAGLVNIGGTSGTTLQLNNSITIGNLAGGGTTTAGGGTVNLQGNTLTFGDATNTTYGGGFSGTSGSGLIKQGSGTFTLSTASSIPGSMTINAGTVLVSQGNFSGGAITLGANNVTLQFASNGSAGVSGTGGATISNNIVVGSSVTSTGAKLWVGGNQGSWKFTGTITGAGSGAQTLLFDNRAGLTTGGDRNTTTFSGVISDGSNGGTLSLSFNINPQSGGGTNVHPAYVNLTAANTFTGNITATRTLALPTSGISTSWLVIGGELWSDGANNTPTYGREGTGYLGANNSGNYTGNILFGNSSLLNLCYFSSANQTFSGVLGGASANNGALVKQGSGTLTLTNANTYTGATTVSQGTLNLGGGTANGSLASTVLNLNGGTLSYTRTGNTTQSFTTTNLTATGLFAGSVSNLSVVSGNTLNLGTIVNSGGYIDFGNTGAGTVAADTASNVGGIIAGATYNGTNWAVANGAGVAISAYSGSYTSTSTAGDTAGNYTGNNMSVDSSQTPGAVITPNSLRFDTAGAYTLTLTGTTNAIASGGIMVNSTVGDNASTITGGSLLGTSNGNLLVIQNNTNTNGALTIGSVLANSGTASGLVKSGAGTLILTAANTYTGATVINAGTLQIGNGGSTGSLATPTGTAIINKGALAVNRTGSLTLGIITGTGSVSNTGSTLTLNSLNDFSGGFTLNSGQITATTAGAFTGFGTGTVTITGGSFRFNSGSPTVSFDNNMVWNSVVTLSRATSGTPNVIFNGDITLGANSGYANGSSTESHALVFNGDISETGGSRSITTSVGTVGGNSMTFNGQNTFTGDITSGTNGAVNVGGTGYLGGGNYAGNISMGSGDFTYSSSADQILSGAVSGNGSTDLTKSISTTSTLTLSGANTYTGVTTVSAGTLKFAKSSALYNSNTANWTAAKINVQSGGTLAFNVGGAGEFTTGNVTTLLTNLAASTGATNGMNAGSKFGFDTTNASGGTFTIADVIADTTGAGGGARGLTKLGSGALVLSNTNTYSGATTVSAGTLHVTGSLVNSAVTVGANGTIGSNGAAGTLGNGLTISAGGNLDLAGATMAANSTGILSITGGTLTLGNLTFQDLVGWDWANASVGTYELIDGTFTIDWGSTAYLDAGSAYNFGNGNAGYFQSGSLTAVIIAIPEPGVAMLGGLSLLGLLLRRRR